MECAGAKKTDKLPNISAELPANVRAVKALFCGQVRRTTIFRSKCSVFIVFTLILESECDKLKKYKGLDYLQCSAKGVCNSFFASA